MRKALAFLGFIALISGGSAVGALPLASKTCLERSNDALDGSWPPSYISPQVLDSQDSVLKAKAFMELFYQKKLELLRANRKATMDISECLGDAGSRSCSRLTKTREDLITFFEKDVLLRLRAFRTAQSFVRAPSDGTLVPNRDYASIDQQINHELKSPLGYVAIEVQQDALLPAEAGAARKQYVQFWQSFMRDALLHFSQSYQRARTPLQQEKLLRLVEEIQRAAQAGSPEEMILILRQIDYPAWSDTLDERMQDFRAKQTQAWFGLLSQYRVFAFISQATPTLQDYITALDKMREHSYQEEENLLEQLSAIQAATSTMDSSFNLFNSDQKILDITLSEYPQYCQIAAQLRHLSARSANRKSMLLLGGFAVSLALPAFVALPALVALDAAWIYVSREEYLSEKQAFFAFESADGSYREAEHIREAMEDKVMAEIFAPLTLIGVKVPLLSKRK